MHLALSGRRSAVLASLIHPLFTPHADSLIESHDRTFVVNNEFDAKRLIKREGSALIDLLRIRRLSPSHFIEARDIHSIPIVKDLQIQEYREGQPLTGTLADLLLTTCTYLTVLDGPYTNDVISTAKHMRELTVVDPRDDILSIIPSSVKVIHLFYDRDSYKLPFPDIDSVQEFTLLLERVNWLCHLSEVHLIKVDHLTESAGLTRPNCEGNLSSRSRISLLDTKCIPSTKPFLVHLYSYSCSRDLR
jgi:hypothetical protein